MGPLAERRLYPPPFVPRLVSLPEEAVPISPCSRLDAPTTNTPSSATAGPRFVVLLRTLWSIHTEEVTINTLVCHQRSPRIVRLVARSVSLELAEPDVFVELRRQHKTRIKHKKTQRNKNNGNDGINSTSQSGILVLL